MNDWIKESAKLLGQWDKVAAEKAFIRLSQDRAKSSSELLMGYALAQRILDYIFSRYALQKDTLSNEEEETLDLAINLARISIPTGHPLLYIFLKSASYMRVDLNNEVEVLRKELFDNNA